jgi:hypothetical protein
MEFLDGKMLKTFFGFHSAQYYWGLEGETKTVSFEEMEHNLYVRIWKYKHGERFSPKELMENFENEYYIRSILRVIQADLSFPLIVTEHPLLDNRLYILDGFHRFTKIAIEGKKEVAVKIIPFSEFAQS